MGVLAAGLGGLQSSRQRHFLSSSVMETMAKQLTDVMGQVVQPKKYSRLFELKAMRFSKEKPWARAKPHVVLISIFFEHV